ncbi:Phosphoenolpyruvate-protein phosphotransferase, partial [Haemophilus influenzae]
YSGYC